MNLARRSHAVALAGFLTWPLAAQSPSPAATPNPRPCASLPEYRQLDFWIGEWDVSPAVKKNNNPPSRSRIERALDQCVISETYVTRGTYSGRSLNSYNPVKKRWEQFYVDNTGGVHHYTGQARDGNLYYEAEGLPSGGPGSPLAKVKMTFFKQGPDQVRQLGEQSTDEGKTWSTTYDLVYSRRKTSTCSPAADAAALAEVRGVATGIVAADNARALDRVLAFYAPGAVLLPPNEAPVVGLDQIRPRYESLFASFDPAIETRIDDVCVTDGLAIVRGKNGGRLKAKDGGPGRALNDSFLMELTRSPDGRWQIRHLMWHGDR